MRWAKVLSSLFVPSQIQGTLRVSMPTKKILELTALPIERIKEIAAENSIVLKVE